MKLTKIKSNTPGTRHTIKINKNLLLKKDFLFKNLTTNKHRFVGRSSLNGRITVSHKGSGCKKKYKTINFYNNLLTTIVIAVAYDASRSCFISLNFDLQRRKFLTLLAPNFLFSGFIVSCNTSFNFLKFGYRTTIQLIPNGSVVHGLSLSNHGYTKYARSAGTSCQIVQKSFKTSKIRLPSGIFVAVDVNCFATLGINSNTQHNMTCIGKAGKNRLKGRRPCVRGIAMNPVDHPHGGRTNSGFVYVTPWGIPTKGIKTKKY